MATKVEAPKQVESFVHQDASRRNLPTAEFQSVMRDEEQQPLRVAFSRSPEFDRRNPDLDPQLIWRGKYPTQDADLTVPAPPLYIQEKVNPKAIIDDLRREAGRRRRAAAEAEAPSLFADPYAAFNGLPSEDAKTEFYRHDAHWSNRMILGDSLQVMASLAEREELRGKVQCIYLDPPYGIKFNSNFQWSTTSRDVRDGNVDHITREPEQVKAFRDTWRDGIHSYLTYLRDRLTVARELLTESGSIFVQIGDENVHRVRAVMDEVFGAENFAGQISFFKTSSPSAEGLSSVVDFLLWYAKSLSNQRYKPILREKAPGDVGAKQYTQVIDEVFSSVRPATSAELRIGSNELRGWRFCALGPTTSQDFQENRSQPYTFQGVSYSLPRNRHWSLNPNTGEEMDKLARLGRLRGGGKGLRSVLLLDDNPTTPIDNIWLDTGSGSFGEDQVYVVQTALKVTNAASS